MFGPAPTVDYSLSVPPRAPPVQPRYPFQIIRRPIKAAGTEQQLPDGSAIDLGGPDLAAQQANNPAPAIADIVPASGMDVLPNFFASFMPNPYYVSGGVNQDTSPVIVTFAPNGTVDKVYSWDERVLFNPGGSANVAGGTANGVQFGWQGRQPLSQIYFLVTRRELIGGDASVKTASAATPQYGIQDLTSLWVTINPQTGLISSSENAPINASLFAGAPPNFAMQCYEARQFARQSQQTGGR
jgi:hypothetical protein